MTKILTCALAGASLLMTACASTENAPYSFNNGWRHAKVLEVGVTRTAERVVRKDCREELAPDLLHARYAVVSYSFGGRSTLRAKQIVAVPSDLVLTVGDQVDINIVDCSQPVRLHNAAQSSDEDAFTANRQAVLDQIVAPYSTGVAR